jgi:hypothetical protein
MPIITGTQETYDVTNIPEDVLEKIWMFEREETPVSSGATKRKVDSPTPEWQDQALTAAGANAMVQGDTFTVDAQTASVRRKNHTQILRKVISNTGTNQATKHYGYDDQQARSKAIAYRELLRDVEFARVQNVASVVGTTGVAPKMGGIETWATSNVSRGAGGSNGGYNTGTGVTAVATDGTQRVYTEDLFLGVMQTGYDNGSKFNQIHLGSFNKRRMSTFQGAQQRMSEEKSSSSSVDVYITDFGKITASINPQQRTRTAILYDMEGVAVLNLRAMQRGKLAKTNDSDEEFVLTEQTTQVVQKAIGVIADLTTS